MLIDFSVENYRSFKERQTFSFLPAEGKSEVFDHTIKISDKYTLLTTGIIYGANASGKSNFVRAIHAMRSLILNQLERRPDEGFREYDPFVFNTQASKSPITFEINFLLKGVRYLYVFSFTERKIIKEKLLFYPEGREAKLFNRTEQKYEFGDQLKGQKSLISKITTENQSFISKAAYNNIPQLREVYSFFSRNLYIIPLLDFHQKSYTNYVANVLLEAGNNHSFTKQFKALLNSFDVGIEDIDIIKDKDYELPWEEVGEIMAKHGLYDDGQIKIGTVDRPFQEESTGTQKLFALGGLMLQALKNGQTIIIDEFEQSLHPSISSYLLKLFNDPKINTKGAQLIAATHDTNLLAQNNLRRDQIWIVEKDKTGASELFSLADITGIPKGTPYEKWYLSGRLGGIPTIKSLDFELSYKADEKR